MRLPVSQRPAEPFHLPCDEAEAMPAALQETLRAAGLEAALPAPGTAPIEAPDFSAEIVGPVYAEGGFVRDANGVALLIAAGRSGLRCARVAQITEACLDAAPELGRAAADVLVWINAQHEGEADQAREVERLRLALMGFADALRPAVSPEAVAHQPLQILQALTERDYSAGPGLAVPPADLVSVSDVIRAGEVHADQHRAAFQHGEA